MSQAEEVIARLTQVRSRLAPLTERLLDIEARLAAAKATDIERSAKISLREFTSNLLSETQHHSRRTITTVEKHGMAIRQAVK
jgi:lipid II:glycine glycyltransferase (peptidoglycan interpeptide bridge formation enzyme)